MGDGMLSLTAIQQTQPANETPTLDAAPHWSEGEWWKVKVTDVYDKKGFETTRVVAGQEDASWLVGMPRDAFSNELMVLHLPGFGQVSKKDLSFQVHNCPFQPVQFPLRTGESWKTKFECRDFDAKVTVKSPTTADVEMTNAAGEHMVLTYDATIHEVRRIVFDNYATLEVEDHGYGYQGIVTVPHMFHLVFQQVRVGPLLGPGNAPMAPTETVHVDPTYGRISFVEILGNVLPLVQPGAPNQAAGYYDEKVTAPDGKVFETTMTPTESGLKLTFWMADKPGGDWTFQHVVGGPGLVESEGVAYHVYDVAVPSSQILTTNGQPNAS